MEIPAEVLSNIQGLEGGVEMITRLWAKGLGAKMGSWVNNEEP